MNKKQVAVLMVALVLCVLVGVAIPMAAQADALAPFDAVLDQVLYDLNQIPH